MNPCRAENTKLASLAELQQAAGVIDFGIGKQAAGNACATQVPRGGPEFLEASQLRADVSRDI